MTRFTLALALALFIGLGTPARSTENTTLIPDGAWWTTMTNNEKIVAIEGMYSGYYAGWADGVLNAASKATRASSAWPRWVDAALIVTPNFSDRTLAVVVARLDAVFVGHPERAKWLVYPFFKCAAASGWECSREIRKQIREHRR